MKKPGNLAFLLFLIVGTIIIVGQNKPTFRTQQGKIFGTLYTVTYEHNADLQPQIVAAMQAVDNSLSPFNKQSIINCLFRAAHSRQTLTQLIQYQCCLSATSFFPVIIFVLIQCQIPCNLA